ncbi:MAG: hypothetical protein IT455_13790 [Planctomycetes bacterium]|nr:hypothetical protein [Planctomycetota bacterium]
MDLLHWILLGLLPALALVLLGVGVGGPRLLAFSLSASVCLPFGVQAGWPPWFWHLSLTHGDASNWLWWCLCWTGICGVAYDLRLLPKALLLPCELLLVVLVPWFVTAPLRAGWSFEVAVLGLAAAWGQLGGTWVVLRRAAKVDAGIAVPLAGAVALAADALLLRSYGSGLAWQLAGVAAFALGIAVMTTLWRRPFVCGTGGALGIVVVHFAALWLGRGSRELLRPSFLLAAAAPLPLWLSTTKAFADGRRLGVVIGLFGVVALAVTAVVLV